MIIAKEKYKDGYIVYIDESKERYNGKIDEVMCDVCWKTMSEWRKEE